MVDLYTALKLIGLFDKPGEIVYLRRSDDDTPRATEILSVKAVKEKYDLRHTSVVAISPYFICYEYEGILLTVA